MKHTIRVLALFAAMGTGACLRSHPRIGPVAESHSRATLVHAIDSMVAAPEFRSAQWGVLIVDPIARDTIYKHNETKLFIPASNQKLVTTSVILEQLGPDFRYRTTFAARGTVNGGTLDGELVVIGRGDPTVSDHMQKDAMLPLRAIADSLRAHGIRHITGLVEAAGDAFPGPVAGYGWPWDGLDASSYAGVDELLFNEGLSTIHITAGKNPGDSASVETLPARTYPAIRSAVTTVARDPSMLAGERRPAFAGRGWGRGGPGTHLTAYHDTTTGGSVVVVRGQIVAGDSAEIIIAQHDPDAAYVAALIEAFRERGVVIDEVDRLPPPVPHARMESLMRIDTLFSVQSVPLKDILPFILKPSQNQIAEGFLRTLGLERTGVGTADSGRRVIERQFADWKIPVDGFVVRDGSGLSRSDYISPEAVVDILDVMRRSPNFDLFFESLPIAGVDGTIATRMRGTPAQGNLHAKTGTLPMVRSLSGYVHTADGRLLEFSILCNAWTTPQAAVDRVADEIGVAMASMQLR